MAPQNGTGSAWLGALENGAASGYEFTELVRHLVRVAGAGLPGSDMLPEKETIRFVPDLTLSFTETGITGLSRADDRIEVSTRFLGLYGNGGALPWPYTERLLESNARGRHARAFLDIFNHRMISLFFRAAVRYTTGMLEQDAQGRPGGNLARYLQSLLGLGTAGLSRNLTLSPQALIRYAGLFFQRPRSAAGLEAVLGDLLNGIQVEVRTFVGAWLDIPAVDRCRLGRKHRRSLGRNTMIGRRTFRPQAGFRVDLKRLDLDVFLALLPGTGEHAAACEVCRLFAGSEHAFTLRVELEKTAVPRCRLGRQAAVPPRLGWTTWPRTARPARRDGVVNLRCKSPLSTSRGERRWEPARHPICPTS